MPVGQYHGAGVAGEYVRQMLRLEAVRQGFHQGYHQAEMLLAVEAGVRMEAVVAAAAVVPRIVLPEIAQQQFPAANSALHEVHHLLQEVFPDFLLVAFLAEYEFVELLGILGAVV